MYRTLMFVDGKYMHFSQSQIAPIKTIKGVWAF